MIDKEEAISGLVGGAEMQNELVLYPCMVVKH